MHTSSDSSQNQFLEIDIELKKTVQPRKEIEQEIQKRVLHDLLAKNSEYHNNYTHLKDKVIPRIVLWCHEDPTYFKPGIKQKWVEK